MLGRLNISKKTQSGGDSSLNLFAQSTEPETKKGIWIDTSATEDLPEISKFEYEGIKTLDKDFCDGEIFMNKFGQALKYIPLDSSLDPSLISVGTDLFILNESIAYKYDTLTDTYTQVSPVPYSCLGSRKVSIGTNIFIFGSITSGYTKTVYKYDTLTDTYTQLPDLSYEAKQDSAYKMAHTTVGTSIYWFHPSGWPRRACKYDTVTGSSTLVATLPERDYLGDVVVGLGDYIYLFDGVCTYKYDTLNDSYTKLRPIPYGFSITHAIAKRNKIHLFGGSHNNKAHCYVYDIATDTYTRQSQVFGLTGSNYISGAASVGEDIYVMAGTALTRYGERTDTFTHVFKAECPLTGLVTQVGTSLYFFGGSYSTFSAKYDTLTNKYSRLRKIPDSGVRIGASIGDDVYLFYYYSSYDKYAYKYNTLSDTYTQITSPPIPTSYVLCTALGIYVYLFATTSSDSFKYNTVTNQYEQITAPSFSRSRGKICAVAGDIYFVGVGPDYTSTYKYDTLTDTYTQLADSPCPVDSSMVCSIDTDVYLFGSYSGTYGAQCCKYNTLTDSYVQLFNMPFGAYNGTAVSIGETIYLCGSYYSDTQCDIHKRSDARIRLLDNYIYLVMESDIPNAILYNDDAYPISNAYIIQNNTVKHYPVYYGDGIQWKLLQQ